jgi:hypothetical protein
MLHHQTVTSKCETGGGGSTSNIGPKFRHKKHNRAFIAVRNCWGHLLSSSQPHSGRFGRPFTLLSDTAIPGSKSWLWFDSKNELKDISANESIFSLLSLFKKRLMRSSVCLCVSVFPLTLLGNGSVNKFNGKKESIRNTRKTAGRAVFCKVRCYVFRVVTNNNGF